MRYIIVLFSVLLVSNVCSSTRTISKRNAETNNSLLNESTIEKIATKILIKKNSISECFDDYTNKPDFKESGRTISEAKCLEYESIRKHRWERRMEVFKCIVKLIVDTKYHRFTGIVVGRDASTAEFPHMGAVGWKSVNETWAFKCGCSLISSKFTLTAAHCSQVPLKYGVKNRVPEIVRLGHINITDFDYEEIDKGDAKILRIIVHPSYSSPEAYFDIALMEIEERLYFSSKIQPACLWGQFNTSELGTTATVTGWGVVETATGRTSEVLQVAEVDIISSEQCDDLLQDIQNRHWRGFLEHQICAGNLAGGADTCQGDSGGPLQVKIPLLDNGEGSMYYIIGLTSFNKYCGEKNKPGVYTRVSSFIDWIESIVWPEN